MIKQSTIEKIKDIKIQDVLEKYIELKKNGANLKACCPFHGEKTASFVVSPSKQIYHCFGCGVGGDSIKFVMEYKSLDFQGAIKEIAGLFNISIEKTNNYQDKYSQNILQRYNDIVFKKSLDKDHIKYLYQRSVTQAEIEKWEIGYAPRGPKQREIADKNLFLASELISHHLYAQNKDKVYPIFANRIIIPIKNEYGHIVGFTGRYYGNREDIAKYLNSPQSNVFDKSSIFFGLDLAKQHIRKAQQVIIVEGHFDVILSHKAGFENTIGTQGTALTEKHINILKKYNTYTLLVFDGDKAGINAAFKAAQLITQNQIQCSVVIMPDGMDPAEMISKSKVVEYEKLLNNPIDAVRFVLLEIVKNANLDDPYKKKDAYIQCTKYLESLKDEIIADEYKAYLSTLLQIDITKIQIKKTETKAAVDALMGQGLETSLLFNMYHKDSLVSVAKNIINDRAFSSEEHRKLYEELQKTKSDQDDFRLTKLAMIEQDVVSEDEFRFGCKMLQRRYLTKLKSRYKDDFATLQKINQKLKETR